MLRNDFQNRHHPYRKACIANELAYQTFGFLGLLRRRYLRFTRWGFEPTQQVCVGSQGSSAVARRQYFQRPALDFRRETTRGSASVGLASMLRVRA